MQFNIGHLETVAGAQEGIRKAGWDGVLLGGNYVAGEGGARAGPPAWGARWAAGAGGLEGGARPVSACRPLPQPLPSWLCCRGGAGCVSGADKRGSASKGACEHRPHAPHLGGFPTPVAPSLAAAGVALGKCIEYGYTFADQVAAQLAKSGAKTA